MTPEPTEPQIKVYRYRWVIIAVFAVINIVVQLQWLSFAPIAKAAQSVYGVSALQIDFFSILGHADILLCHGFLFPGRRAHPFSIRCGDQRAGT
jgi:hypothetical protein